MRQHEHGPAPSSSVDLPELRRQTRLPTQVVGSPSAQRGADRLDNLIHDRVGADKSDHPVHPIVWPGDKAVQRHRHVP